jgi:beta-lactamase regulating signal transducer with metallopeptidase domain
MHRSNLSRFATTLLLALSLIIVPCAVQALAQNSGSSTATQPGAQTQSGGSSSSSQSTTTTTTTKSTAPTESTRTTTTTTVDPLWIAIGAIALLAILAIAIFSMRGRSRDTVATVHERETVVKKD